MSSSTVLEIRRRLVEYINLTNHNFARMNDRLEKMELKMHHLEGEISEISEVNNVDKLNKIELQMAEMVEEIYTIKETVNVEIKECLKEILLLI